MTARKAQERPRQAAPASDRRITNATSLHQHPDIDRGGADRWAEAVLAGRFDQAELEVNTSQNCAICGSVAPFETCAQCATSVDSKSGAR